MARKQIRDRENVIKQATSVLDFDMDSDNSGDSDSDGTEGRGSDDNSSSMSDASDFSSNSLYVDEAHVEKQLHSGKKNNNEWQWSVLNLDQ